MAAAASARTSPRHSRSHAAAAPAPARRRPRPASPRHAPRPASTPARNAPATRAALRFVDRGANGMLDRLLRGRLWVGCIGVLLFGIVFLNVSLLELNQEIARTSQKAGAIDRQNSELRMKLAGLDSTQRIVRIASRRGMVFPQAGDYRYLSPGSGDGLLAAQRATTPQPGAGAAAATAASPSTVAPSTAAQQSMAAQGTPAYQQTPATTARPAASPSSSAGRSLSPPTAAAAPVAHP